MPAIQQPGLLFNYKGLSTADQSSMDIPMGRWSLGCCALGRSGGFVLFVGSVARTDETRPPETNTLSYRAKKRSSLIPPDASTWSFKLSGVLRGGAIAGGRGNPHAFISHATPQNLPKYNIYRGYTTHMLKGRTFGKKIKEGPRQTYLGVLLLHKYF